MVHVDIKPKLFQWACERVGMSTNMLENRFPHLEEWETNKLKPTLKQLEDFAKYTRTPLGFFFLPEPPVEKLPVADFRTVENEFISRPSPDLLETIYICQQRQDWYRNYLKSEHENECNFVGSSKLSDNVITTANKIRKAIRFDLEERSNMPTWTDALRKFIGLVDESGIMVMCSGVVLNNTKRVLNPEEFRGFALADKYAPVIYINGADTKAAQMFTLAHELAHIWLGVTGLSDAQAAKIPSQQTERWCNEVAAELLVPLSAMRAEYNMSALLSEETKRLAHHFKVSTLVILRRIFDSGGITKEQLSDAFSDELKKIAAARKGTGGNFYLTQAARVGKRFSNALVRSTLEGQTLYRDAFKMLGISKQVTFQKLSKSLGIS